MPDDPKKIGDDLVKGISGALTYKPQRDAVSNTWSNMVNKVKNTASGISDSVKSGLKEAGSELHDALDFSNKPDTPAPAATPKYHKGTDYVPKTGPAILKKGEAVLNNKDAENYRQGKSMKASDAMKGASEALGGKSTPPKEIEHIKTKKAKSGGYVHEHHHTHPEHHPMETHVTPDQDAMAEHMMQHMGTPNPGEADADAGQGGIPGAAPTTGAPAAAPTPGM
jgi:hypothetical protein